MNKMTDFRKAESVMQELDDLNDAIATKRLKLKDHPRRSKFLQRLADIVVMANRYQMQTLILEFKNCFEVAEGGEEDTELFRRFFQSDEMLKIIQAF